MKKTLYVIALLAAVVLYTRIIWLSGFDQGTDVALCVVDSMLTSEGETINLAETESCNRAKSYESNPLWQLRRRDGQEQEQNVPDAQLNLVKNIT